MSPAFRFCKAPSKSLERQKAIIEEDFKILSVKGCCVHCMEQECRRRGKICLSSPSTSSQPVVRPKVGAVQTSLLLDCIEAAEGNSKRGTWTICFARGVFCKRQLSNPDTMLMLL